MNDNNSKEDWIDKEEPIINETSEKLDKIFAKHRKKVKKKKNAKKKFDAYQTPGVDEADYND